MPPAGSAASLRQFGGETYRDKLAKSVSGPYVHDGRDDVRISIDSTTAG